MLNLFENPWLLLTLAGIALIAAGLLRQGKPEWGLTPLLFPVLLAGLGFGLDAMVRTDYESIVHIIMTCRKAAVARDSETIVDFISPEYSDSAHRSKPTLAAAAKSILERASIKKVRVTSHIITLRENSAESELQATVHLNQDSEYPMAGSLVFVEMGFEYKKIGKQWFIQRAEVTQVNYQPMNWGAVP